MFRNYLATAWRNLLKYKFFSIINLLGLSIGFSFSILIISFICQEWSVNSNFSNAESIFRVSSVWKQEEWGNPQTTLAPIGPILHTNYPEVIIANRYWRDWIPVKICDDSPYKRNQHS